MESASTGQDEFCGRPHVLRVFGSGLGYKGAALGFALRQRRLRLRLATSKLP